MINNIKEELSVNKGVTLVALVITIVVLLILSGISISMLTQESGIIEKAQSAKDAAEKSDTIERVQAAVLSSYNKFGDIEITKLETNLKNEFGDEGDEITIPEDGFGTENKIEITVNGYTIVINSDGDVSEKVQEQ